jgi:hypothetical protein
MLKINQFGENLYPTEALKNLTKAFFKTLKKNAETEVNN